MWHISQAKYIPEEDKVSYRIVFSHSDCETALTQFNRMAKADIPVCLYHENAVHLDNPYLAMIDSHAYNNEHRKVKGE